MFHAPCTLLFTVYFDTVISVLRTSIYAVFVIDRTRKQTLLIQLFDFAFTKGPPSISQSNVQTVKAEKEKQYTWVTWYALKYQIVAYFSLKFILKLLKCTQTN